MTNYAHRPQRTDLLWNVLPLVHTITSIVLVRISDAEDIKGLFDMVRQMGRRQGGSLITAALAHLTVEDLRPGAAGDELRQSKGLVPVTFAHLDPRASNGVVAYVQVVGNVLVVLAPSSAIESNLPPLEGDRVGLPRNGITCLVQEAIVRLPGLRRLYVPLLSRLLRRLSFIGEILDLLREQQVLLVDETGEQDLSNLASLLGVTLNATTKGDQDAINRKQTMLGGRLDALEVDEDGGLSGRDFAWYSCPPGYGPQFELRQGLSVPIKKSIQVDVTWLPYIQKLWRAFAAGLSIAEIALDPVLDKMPLRNGSGRSLADLEAPARRDRVRQFFTTAQADLHSAGIWDKYRWTAAPLEDANGHALTVDAAGRRGKHVQGRLPVHLVDDLPWGIEEATWDAVRARLRAMPGPETPEERARRGARAKLVFTSTPTFPVAGGWARLLREHGAVQLRVMHCSTDAAPRWDSADSALLGATNAVTAVQVLGRAVASALIEASAGEQELQRCGDDDEGAVVRGLLAELETARGAVTEARRAATVQAQLAAHALESGNRFSLQEHQRAQEEILATAHAITVDISKLEQDVVDARTAPPQDRVELRTPMAVAAALMRWDGESSELLTRAVAQLELLKHLTARVDDGAGEIVGNGKVRLLDPDGGHLLLDYGFRWPNTSSRRQLGSETPELVRCWAAGEPFAELGTRFRQSPDLVRVKVRGWLSQQCVGRMAGALVDCPVPVIRQIVISGMRPTLIPVPNVSTALLDHVRASYADNGKWKAWLGHSPENDGRALAALAASPGPVDVRVLAELGVRSDKLTTPEGGRPAIAAGTRGKRALKPCVHADCDSEFASVLLYTPETRRWGVLCTTCRRVPDLTMADVVFPEEHVRGWTRISTNDRLTTVLASPVTFTDEERDLLTSDLIRIDELEPILRLTQGGVRNLRRRAGLPPCLVLDKVELWKRADIHDCAEARANSTATRYGMKDDLLSPTQAAAMLGVTPRLVRMYVADGQLAAKPIVGAKGTTTLRIKPAVLAAFRVPPGDLLTSMTLHEVGQLAAVDSDTVRSAVARGELTLAATTTAVQRVIRADAEAFAHRTRSARGSAPS